MTNVKDKLSASVKQARSQQKSVEAVAASEEIAVTASPVEVVEVIQTAVAEVTPTPTPTAAAPVSSEAKPKSALKPKSTPTPTPTPPPETAAAKPAGGNDVQPSGSTLFPSRVWPD
jgi:hypothetical protein